MFKLIYCIFTTLKIIIMKKLPKAIKWTLLIFVGFSFIVLLFGPKIDMKSPAPSFSSEQTGYFKADRFRVFTFYVSDTSWTKIQDLGDGLMHTDGRPTVAYFYTNRNLAKDITSQTDFMTALKTAYVPGCVALYWKSPSGKVIFKKFPNTFN